MSGTSSTNRPQPRIVEDPFYKCFEETIAISPRGKGLETVLEGKFLYRWEVVLLPPDLAIVLSRHFEKFQSAVPGQDSAPVAQSLHL